MKRVLFCAFALMVLGWAAGCDSNDESTDAERFVNNWSLSEVSDSRGDQTATFLAGYDGITVDFASGGNYTLMVDVKDTGQDVSLSGPYTVNESSKTVSLTIEIQGQSLSLPLSYSFRDDSTLLLSGNSLLVNSLFQTGLEGTVQLTFTAN